MKIAWKKIMIACVVVLVLVIVAFGLYQLYEIAIVNAIARIKAGLRTSMSPFRIFGSRK